MEMDARQFHGTYGSAKAIVQWLGGNIAVAGTTAGNTDDMDGGLNLVTTQDNAPFYTTVSNTDWVVRRGQEVVTMTNAQFRMAWPNYQSP